MSDNNDSIKIRLQKIRLEMAQRTLKHNQQIVEVPNGNSNMIAIKGSCVLTGNDCQTDAYSQDLLFSALHRWAVGELAQVALSFMSSEEREFVISGICPAGWATMNEEELGDREPFFPKPSTPEDRELSQRTAMREALTGMRMALMLLIHSSENAEWIKTFDAAHYSGMVLDNLDHLITTLNNKEPA